jgi:hypothetical protein
MPTEQLPPGPGHRIACPECGEAVQPWPKAMSDHRQDHRRAERAEKRKRQKQTAREATARLRKVNRLRAENRAAAIDTVADELRDNEAVAAILDGPEQLSLEP